MSAPASEGLSVNSRATLKDMSDGGGGREKKMWVIGVPEKNGGKEAIFEETTTEEFPIIIKMINPPTQGAKWTRWMSARHMKKPISSHVLIILLKSMGKEQKICKAARGERRDTYRTQRWRWCGLSGGKQCENALEQTSKSTRMSPPKKAFRNEGDTDTEMLTYYITSRPTLQETLHVPHGNLRLAKGTEGQEIGNRMGK